MEVCSTYCDLNAKIMKRFNRTLPRMTKKYVYEG